MAEFQGSRAEGQERMRSQGCTYASREAVLLKVVGQGGTLTPSGLRVQSRRRACFRGKDCFTPLL